ncbi:carbohydrate kinase family protein [Halococcus salifodinae]|uniref:PfkB domain-containing protein n=1 Tax=Halococcus salifodinae DSM 8989 TaxID=1227456 RepID=M0MVT3_9EURY|nr:sugar kinase [Halococcus salifodinae]EMA48515.1 PfkB domain-containing protein [Halococcus salifodinae DSM 8989]
MTYDILVMGEAFVDFLPESVGPTENVNRFQRRAGGSAINVAIGLANLDEVPLLRTRVGRDPFGKFLKDTVSEHEIPLTYFETDATAQTSLSVVSRDTESPSDLSFTFYRHQTADTRMEPDLIPDEVLADTKWVHITSVPLGSEPSRTATLSLMRRARKQGCTVSFFPNTRPQLWSRPGQVERDISAAIELSDIVMGTPSELAAAGYKYSDPSELALKLCEMGPEAVFLCIDSVRAFGYVTSEQLEGVANHDGFGVTPKHPIGSTDAFTAAVIASYMNDVMSLQKIVKSASAVASISTMSPGAITAFSLKETASSLFPDLPWSN